MKATSDAVGEGGSRSAPSGGARGGSRAPAAGGKRPGPRIGLRLTLLIALLPLAALPWIGLRFVERMAELARDAQWETQRIAARSLAASLHERRELFDAPGTGGRIPRGVEPLVPDALAVRRADGTPIDGSRPDDDAARWRDVARRPLPVEILGNAPASTLRVRIALARIGVGDTAVSSVARAGESTPTPPGDPARLRLRIEADDERFVAPGELQTAGDGPVVLPGDSVTVLVGADDALLAALGADDAARASGAAPPPLPELPTRIPAALQEDGGGWHAELDLPDDARLIRVLATDVDYLGARQIEARADSGDLLVVVPRDPAFAQTLARERDRRWTEVLRAMDRGGGRISIVDAGGALLAQRGEPAASSPLPDGAAARLARRLLAGALRGGPDFGDHRGAPITTALAGVPAHAAVRLPSDAGMPAWLLASAHPIWIDERVAGALLLEDSTVVRLSLAQEALERLVLLVAAALLATVLALLAVATLAVARIVRLRRAAESAIDARGRVVGEVPRFRLRDEVDALAASYNRVLARLREHQDYLAKLRARLLHELRTPIMVVRSSLDNLAAEAAETAGNPAAVAEYARRAQAGAARLERIVAGMGEAGSLETLLEASDLERVDLVALASACVAGYTTAFPAARFVLDARVAAAPCLAVPEAIAQALDKLVANAVDFAPVGTPITLRIGAESRRGQRCFTLAVMNQGPPLPAVMTESLFESMVSIRGDGAGSTRGHLGLGLYLVRLIAEFHGGAAFARDVAGGVEVGFGVAAGAA